MIATIKTIVKKEFLQVSRDKQTLIALIVVPIFLLIMFGYAISLDVKNITMAVYDRDASAVSREFISSFVNSGYFEMTSTPAGLDEIDRLIASERCKIAIVIPEDFSKNIISGATAHYQVVVDGSNASAAATIAGYVNVITENFGKKAASRYAAARGSSAGTAAVNDGEDDTPASVLPVFKDPAAPPVDLRFRTWFNPELKSVFFLVPGLIAMIMVVSAVLATSLAIVREKEHGSMEQLRVSPVTSLQLVIGKTIPYICITLTTATMILLASYFFFGIEVKGNYVLLGLCTIVFLNSCLGIGILISTLADSQQVAFMLASITTTLPSYILSGFIFPIRNMPLILQLFSYLIPARYFLVMLRSVILKGSGFLTIWPELLGLFIYACVTLTLGILRLQRQMKA
ncbi:MAG: ABC transporter permease [Spirochaetales bacterium]|nr:ABC transporter permease [Spirochaetales bacterium]